MVIDVTCQREMKSGAAVAVSLCGKDGATNDNKKDLLKVVASGVESWR